MNRLFLVIVAMIIVGCKLQTSSSSKKDEKSFKQNLLAPAAITTYFPDVSFNVLDTEISLQIDENEWKVKGQVDYLLTPFAYQQQLLQLHAPYMQIVEVTAGGEQLIFEQENDDLVISLLHPCQVADSLFISIKYEMDVYKEQPFDERAIHFLLKASPEVGTFPIIYTSNHIAGKTDWFPSFYGIYNHAQVKFSIIHDSRFRLRWGNTAEKSIQSNGQSLSLLQQKGTNKIPNLSWVLIDKEISVEKINGNLSLVGNLAEKDIAKLRSLIDQLDTAINHWIKPTKIDFIFSSNDVFDENFRLGCVFVNLNKWNFLTEFEKLVFLQYNVLRQSFYNQFVIRRVDQIAIWDGLLLEFAAKLMEEKQSHQYNRPYRNLILDKYLLRDAPDKLGVLGKSQYQESNLYKSFLIFFMLRDLLGTDIYEKSLVNFLKGDDAPVELADLRKTFEKSSGKDLSWFFEQWFVYPSHPTLAASFLYQSDTLYIGIDQVQSLEETTIFKLPLWLDIHHDNEVKSYPVWVTYQHHEFKIPLAKQPKAVTMDTDEILLAEIIYSSTFPANQWMYLVQSENRNANKLASVKLTQYPYSNYLQFDQLTKLLQTQDAEVKALVFDFLKNGKPNIKTSLIRSALIDFQIDGDDPNRYIFHQLLEKYNIPIDWDRFGNDQDVIIKNLSLISHFQSKPNDLETVIKKVDKETNILLTETVSDFISKSTESGYSSWFNQTLRKYVQQDRSEILRAYFQYVSKSKAISEFKFDDYPYEILSESTITYERFWVFHILCLHLPDPNVKRTLDEFIISERNLELKSFWIGILNDYQRALKMSK